MLELERPRETPVASAAAWRVTVVGRVGRDGRRFRPAKAAGQRTSTAGPPVAAAALALADGRSAAVRIVVDPDGFHGAAEGGERIRQAPEA